MFNSALNWIINSHSEVNSLNKYCHSAKKNTLLYKALRKKNNRQISSHLIPYKFCPSPIFICLQYTTYLLFLHLTLCWERECCVWEQILFSRPFNPTMAPSYLEYGYFMEINNITVSRKNNWIYKATINSVLSHIVTEFKLLVRFGGFWWRTGRLCD